MSQKEFRFELIVNHSFEYLSFRIKFSGSENEGVYDLWRPGNDGERHKWNSVPLKPSDWKMLRNTIYLARLDELPEEEPPGEWMTLDGAYYTINVQTEEKRFSRTRHNNPEKRFSVVVNKMIDLVPQLNGPVKTNASLEDYYKL